MISFFLGVAAGFLTALVLTLVGFAVFSLGVYVSSKED